MDVAQDGERPVAEAPSRGANRGPAGAPDAGAPGWEVPLGEYVLRPPAHGGHPRARGLRVVGPGRRERDYQGRIDDLRVALDRAERVAGEVDLVERGTARYADRLERERQDALAREAEARHQLHRTLVLLGATQRELEGARAQLAGERSQAAIEGPSPRPSSGWFPRLLRRLRGRP